MAWSTQGRQTDPDAGTILADTGAISVGGLLGLTVVIAATTGCYCTIARRNTLNNADVESQMLAVQGGQTAVGPLSMSISSGQRVVVRLDGAIGGDVQASLFS
jgi:hypothetical protein